MTVSVLVGEANKKQRIIDHTFTSDIWHCQGWFTPDALRCV